MVDHGHDSERSGKLDRIIALRPRRIDSQHLAGADRGFGERLAVETDGAASVEETCLDSIAGGTASEAAWSAFQSTVSTGQQNAGVSVDTLQL